MSTRFYINGVQIFGNNEMYENTRQELIKQIGIDCYKVEYFHDKKIKDPDSLLVAIENDIKEEILVENKNFFKEDKDLFCFKSTPVYILEALKNRHGSQHCFLNICLELVDLKKFFIPLVAYLAMKDKIDNKDGKFVLKKNRIVKVSWY